MAEIFTADAEENDLSEWSGSSAEDGNSVAASAASKLHGSYGFDFQWGGTNNDVYVYKTYTAQDEIYVRFYVQFDTVTDNPGTDVAMVTIEQTGSPRARLYFYGRGAGNALGYDFALDGVSADNKYNTAVFSQDTPYCIEIRWRNETAGGEAQGGGVLYIDGESAFSKLDKSNGSGQAANVYVGGKGNATCANGTRIFFDDVTANTTYIGLYPETISVVPQIMQFYRRLRS